MNNAERASCSAVSGVGGFFLGVLTGAVAAGVITLLYAPKSGPETRESLRVEALETQRMFERWVVEFRERMDRFAQILRSTVKAETRELEPSGNGQREPG